MTSSSRCSAIRIVWRGRELDAPNDHMLRNKATLTRNLSQNYWKVCKTRNHHRESGKNTMLVGNRCRWKHNHWTKGTL
jgi:hypothetical protein